MQNILGIVLALGITILFTSWGDIMIQDPLLFKKYVLGLLILVVMGINRLAGIVAAAEINVTMPILGKDYQKEKDVAKKLEKENKEDG